MLEARVVRPLGDDRHRRPAGRRLRGGWPAGGGHAGPRPPVAVLRREPQRSGAPRCDLGGDRHRPRPGRDEARGCDRGAAARATGRPRHGAGPRPGRGATARAGRGHAVGGGRGAARADARIASSIRSTRCTSATRAAPGSRTPAACCSGGACRNGSATCIQTSAAQVGSAGRADLAAGRGRGRRRAPRFPAAGVLARGDRDQRRRRRRDRRHAARHADDLPDHGDRRRSRRALRVGDRAAHRRPAGDDAPGGARAC